MDSCCVAKQGELRAFRARQKQVLQAVLAVNAGMFVIEFASGWIARSTALLGDALDMFGDASVYALTLFALGASERTRAGIALFKGGVMLVLGMVVLAEAVRRSLGDGVPETGLMSIVAVAALAANAVCFWLLYSRRGDDLNMRSTWLCPRNDLVANVAVLFAAAGVIVTGNAWPDLLVGVGIASLFVVSARTVICEAWRARAAAQGDDAPNLRTAACTDSPTVMPARRAASLTCDTRP